MNSDCGWTQASKAIYYCFAITVTVNYLIYYIFYGNGRSWVILVVLLSSVDCSTLYIHWFILSTENLGHRIYVIPIRMSNVYIKVVCCCISYHLNISSWSFVCNIHRASLIFPVKRQLECLIYLIFLGCLCCFMLTFHSNPLNRVVVKSTKPSIMSSNFQASITQIRGQ